MQVLFSESAQISHPIERSYETLLGALGTPRLDDAFFSSVHAALGDVDRIYCFEQGNNDAPPVLFCASVPGPESPTLINKYRTCYHLFDPTRSVLPTIPDTHSASITLHSDEIAYSDYRQNCYERFSIRHRLSIVKHEGDRWRTLNVARRSGPFRPAEIDSLSTLARLALPLMAKNQMLKVKTSGGNFSVPEMERRLEGLAKGFTARERQVCARTIVGMGAEGAALDLGISLSTVLTYRQRAYRRANVSNAIQLAALVMH